MVLALLFDYFLPVLAYIGLVALVGVSLMAGFWPLIESPLIRMLTSLRDRRAQRRQKAARRRAGRFFDWSRR